VRRTAILLIIVLAVAAGGFAFAAEKAAAKVNPPECPTCHNAANVIPLVYGYPSEEMSEAAERGEIALGG